ncbi:hypothetical protein DPMN_175434 [Dreissena polymorpha]|uniref:Uncharacterized protein n=1 Tax=Dreissena polymorpha TaxID=45954 RepID=A0A9D4IJL3_DREPO|nr:hypothetical protein DPMN_175434 [Dreissena polymorpha]
MAPVYLRHRRNYSLSHYKRTQLIQIVLLALKRTKIKRGEGGRIPPESSLKHFR